MFSILGPKSPDGLSAGEVAAIIVSCLLGVGVGGGLVVFTLAAMRRPANEVASHDVIDDEDAYFVDEDFLTFNHNALYADDLEPNLQEDTDSTSSAR